MRLGYNTNGLAHHRLLDAIELLADEGFSSIAITLDAGALDPYEEPAILARQVDQVRQALDRRGLARVIETGARYLLNPRIKHDPTLMDPDPRAAPSGWTSCDDPQTWPPRSGPKRSRSGPDARRCPSARRRGWTGWPRP